MNEGSRRLSSEQAACTYNDKKKRLIARIIFRTERGTNDDELVTEDYL
jgi:hypothetical protein